MAKKTKTEIEALFKETFTKVKGDRESGWAAEDTANLALPLIKAQTKPDGTSGKLSPESEKIITAALQITPPRIVATVKSELHAAGLVLDAEAESLLLRILDIPKFRAELVSGKVLNKAAKGKKKQSIAALVGA